MEHRPDLGARGQGFWAATTAAYELSDSELILLAECCKTMDQIDELELVIKRVGQTTLGSKGQEVVHPAVTEARGQRLSLHRMISSLQLPDSDGKTVRSPRQTSASKAASGKWPPPRRKVV